ncbi:hypothetical protein Mapa_012986 [Marchantia paleacea]|nr:hypothetical protein Mapa_012986 [Marchantia paleacea]
MCTVRCQNRNSSVQSQALLNNCLEVWQPLHVGVSELLSFTQHIVHLLLHLHENSLILDYHFQNSFNCATRRVLAAEEALLVYLESLMVVDLAIPLSFLNHVTQRPFVLQIIPEITNLQPARKRIWWSVTPSLNDADILSIPLGISKRITSYDWL